MKFSFKKKQKPTPRYQSDFEDAIKQQNAEPKSFLMREAEVRGLEAEIKRYETKHNRLTSLKYQAFDALKIASTIAAVVSPIVMYSMDSFKTLNMEDSIKALAFNYFFTTSTLFSFIGFQNVLESGKKLESYRYQISNLKKQVAEMKDCATRRPNIVYIAELSAFQGDLANKVYDEISRSNADEVVFFDDKTNNQRTRVKETLEFRVNKPIVLKSTGVMTGADLDQALRYIAENNQEQAGIIPVEPINQLNLGSGILKMRYDPKTDHWLYENFDMPNAASSSAPNIQEIKREQPNYRAIAARRGQTSQS